MAEYIAKYDVWVTAARMPLCVKGFCRRKLEDNCVVINEGLSDEAKRAAVKHEIEHFQRGDLERDMPVEVIEEGVRGV